MGPMVPNSRGQSVFDVDETGTWGLGSEAKDEMWKYVLHRARQWHGQQPVCSSHTTESCAAHHRLKDSA